MSQTTTTVYETDFYAWTQQQADLLRQGKLSELDIEHLIEEIEDIGKSQQRELGSRLIVLMAHLLKWHFQPQNRSRSWEATIRIQRHELQNLLRQNPSLRTRLNRAVAEAYRVAVDTAWVETGLDYITFPPACPYTVEQILQADFFPEQ
jgi:glutamine synthetase adenylyltransferase